MANGQWQMNNSMIAEMRIIEKSWIRLAGWLVLGAVCGLLILAGTARLLWHGKYYPGVRVGTVELSGMTREQGLIVLSGAVDNYKLSLKYGDSQWQVPPELIRSEVQESASLAYRIGRRWEIDDYMSVVSGREMNLPLKVMLDESAMNEWIDQVTQIVEIPPTFARAEARGKNVTIINGTDGVIVDRDKLGVKIAEHARGLDAAVIEIPLRAVRRQLSNQELEELQIRGEALLGDRLELKQDDEKIVLGQDVLVGWLVDEAAVREYASSLSSLLDREPQDAKFSFEGGRVREFAPSRDGVMVEVEETVKKLREAYDKLLAEEESQQVGVVVVRTPPAISTDSVNDLGIVERIGRGESYYAHSIANRIFNVGLSSARVNGVLLAPGEEFSFNKFVGEISGATGYKTAYVISGGRTVLGDGGGVCQVSTTLFRAVMDAGLPITERWAHAYRVGYYEQDSPPGIDATVYNPSKDFKFVNDTPAHILVQAINEPLKQHLVFEIYGTKDGRVASISKPIVSGVSPPPPDLYEDDPNLPAGQVKQVDWAAWGARTSFEYRVEKAGTTLFEKTYVSNYRPWANVYLRGTAPTQ